VPVMNELDLVSRLLEAPAPSPEVVAAGRDRLAALAAREPLPASPPRAPRRAGRRRWQVASLAAVAAAAAVTLAVTSIGSGAHRAARPSAALSKAGLSRAILTAFDSAGDDILYVRQSEVNGLVNQVWYSPWQAGKGQRVYLHALASLPGGRPAISVFDAFTMPDPPPADDWSEAIPVIAASTTTTSVDYVHRTWSVSPTSGVNPPLTPSYIEQGISQGDFRIVGRTQVDGQAAIELRWSSNDSPRRTIRLWVDAHSYLPFREQETLASSPQAQGYTQYSTFEFLPPTAANQAHLRVSVPAGYTRIAGPHIPGPTG